MTLTTHAVIGAALASIVPAHPVFGASIAFTSHFLMDAIPHWDYPISSTSVNPHFATKLVLDKKLALDLARIGTDGLLGLILPLVFFLPSIPSTSAFVNLIGAVCAMLPDFLQFVYMRFKREPLISLQKFHMWIHAQTKLDKKPWIGVPFQLALIALIALVAPLLLK